MSSEWAYSRVPGSGEVDNLTGGDPQTPQTAPTQQTIPDVESSEHHQSHETPPAASRPHDTVTTPTTTQSTSHTSGQGSGRSRSHSRSPHRHRHHRRRRFRFKEKERNFLAAVCSMIVIVTLCTALAEPNWFYMRGGGCRSNDDNKSPVHTLGVYQFFYVGHFEETSDGKSHAPQFEKVVYHYNGGNSNDVLINCVTPRIVQVLRSIIALCFVGVAFSLIAFFLDLAGPSDKMMKMLRRNAVFNILTVVVCVTVNGFSFLITQLLESLQKQTKQHHYSKIDIRFDVSFYLVAAAGALSVIAAAFNLLRRYQPYDHNSEQRESLLDDYDSMDIGPLHGTEAYSPMNLMPPPPAYSP